MSNLIFRVDAATASSITLSGSNVSDVANLGSLPIKLRQGTALNQPTYLTANANWKLRNAIQFDGTNDQLDVTDLSNVATEIAGGTQLARTSFVVMRYNSVAGFPGIYARTGTPNGYYMDSASGGTSTRNESNFNGSNNLSLTIAAANSTATTYVYSRRNANGIHQISRNGANVVTSSTAFYEMGGVNVIGRSPPGSYLTGEIAEMLFYNDALSTTHINQVGTFLTQKWGGTWTTIP